MVDLSVDLNKLRSGGKLPDGYINLKCLDREKYEELVAYCKLEKIP